VAPANQWRGQWALITGASSGIGEALAEELAGGGANLVLVARRGERLTSLAARLGAAHNVRVEVLPADLAQRESRQEIFDATQRKGIAVELLVNNAGFGTYGKFQEIPLQRQLEMIEVNVAAVLHLTRLFLPPMLERKRGGVLIVSSTAAFQGVPYLSAYAATKSFDLIFGEGLAEEVRSRGVRVCVLCPGSTKSEFHEVAGEPEFTKGRQETARKVALTGLRALAGGKSMVISGLNNRMLMESQRLSPRAWAAKVAASMFRPRK